MQDRDLFEAVRIVATLPEAEQARAPGRDAITSAIDAWLLRGTNHRPTVGAQIAEWLVRAAQGHDDARADLRALGRSYHVDFQTIASDLGAEHHYGRLLPQPNPRNALEQGAQQARNYFQLLRDSPGNTAESLRDFADGRDLTVSPGDFAFFSMQLRATIVRALLVAWFAGDDGFDRLVGAAQTGEGMLPHVAAPHRLPRRRELLGFVLTEAIDDAFYSQRLAEPNAADDRLTAEGRRLLNVVLTSIAPIAVFDAENETAIARYTVDRAGGYDVVADRSLDDVRFVSRPRVRPASVARNSDNTARPVARDYPFDLIIVPSFSALDNMTPLTTIPPVCLERCQLAKQNWDERLAPFIMVSGGSVYPQGTQVLDADLMADALMHMGVPEESIILEARARHSTTNLRNAGRFMLARNLRGPALVTTKGPRVFLGLFEQDFYFANPTLSTFHSRCDDDLGYHPDAEMMSLSEWVGALDGELDQAAGEGRVVDEAFTLRFGRFIRFHALLARAAESSHNLVFTPSPEVARWGIRDPLDP